MTTSLNQKKSLRKRWLNIRLTETEYTKMMQALEKTTDKKLSNYARKLLLGKPVKIVIEDATFDLFIREMVELRKELNGIGNNFNQLVKQIHITRQTPEQILLLRTSQKIQELLLEKISLITSYVRKVSEKWYQNS